MDRAHEAGAQGDNSLRSNNGYSEPPCLVPMLSTFHLDESGLLAGIKKLTLCAVDVGP